MSDVDTGVFRTAGGWYVEIDVPDEGTQARERHDAAVAKGDFERVDSSTVEKVTDGDGTTRLVRRADAAEETPRRGRGRAAAAADTEAEPDA